MEKLISIIIPVYNREQYLEECLNSVFEQSYQNFEIILVDDGSTDGTLVLCNEFSKKDARVKVFPGEHQGVSVARNIALEKANGDYIFFLDSDDVIHPLLLEALVFGMEKNNVSISASPLINISENRWNRLENYKEKFPAPAEFVYHTVESALREAFTDGKTPINQIGGVMIRRNYIGDTRFKTELYIGEDFYFVYENLIKGDDVAFLKQKWYYCRTHANNSSWDYSFNGFWTRFYRRELVWKKEEELGRIENANIVKRQGYYIFTGCQNRNKPYGPDCRKMRKVMKGYSKTLLPVLAFDKKILYIVALYIPFLYPFLNKAIPKLKSILKRILPSR